MKLRVFHNCRNCALKICDNCEGNWDTATHSHSQVIVNSKSFMKTATVMNYHGIHFLSKRLKIQVQ